MKLITKLEPYNSRIKIYLNEELSFILYKGEVKRFHLTENTEIPENVYNEIMELLYKRARERALYILDSSYKTESQMRQKLKQGFYPDTIVDKVVEYLLEYRLLDDFRYASMYIEYKSESKSKKQLIQDLYAKGISKEIIEEVFLQSDYSDEQSLHRIVEKKLPRYNMEDPKEVQKLYRYLVGKGYRYNDVKNALSKYTTLE